MVAPLGSRKWSLPFSTLVMPWLKDISPETAGLSKLSIEVKFQPNFQTTAGNCRFIRSGQNTNCYTDSDIKFDNIQFRHAFTRHRDATLYKNVNAVIPIQRFSEKQYPLASWNSTSDTFRVQLSNDFSSFSNCNMIYVYITPTTQSYNAFNSASCCQVNSEANLLGWELKFKSRTILN